MNLESLLKQAMELEKVQAMLYKGLEKKFSFSKEISQFWSEMARDEKGHYERMVKMHNQFKPAFFASRHEECVFGPLRGYECQSGA